VISTERYGLQLAGPGIVRRFDGARNANADYLGRLRVDAGSDVARQFDGASTLNVNCLDHSNNGCGSEDSN